MAILIRPRQPRDHPDRPRPQATKGDRGAHPASSEDEPVGGTPTPQRRAGRRQATTTFNRKNSWLVRPFAPFESVVAALVSRPELRDLWTILANTHTHTLIGGEGQKIWRFALDLVAHVSELIARYPLAYSRCAVNGGAKPLPPLLVPSPPIPLVCSSHSPGPQTVRACREVARALVELLR